MSTVGDRLREVRTRAGFSTASDAARGFGWPVSTYLGHENGDRMPSREKAKQYARAFRVRWEWLLEGQGSPSAKNIVKVLGRVAAGGDIDTSVEQQNEHDGLGEIEVPFPLPDDAQALEVTGPSMWPRYDEGDVIIILGQPISTAELLDHECCVLTAEGGRYLKRLKKGARAGVFDLHSHNAPTMHGVRVKSVFPVHSVVRVGQWQRLNNAGRKRLMTRRLK